MVVAVGAPRVFLPLHMLLLLLLVLIQHHHLPVEVIANECVPTRFLLTHHHHALVNLTLVVLRVIVAHLFQHVLVCHHTLKL